MTTDKAQSGPAGSNRQKIIIGVVVVVFAFLAYQIYGMFGGGSAPAPTAQPAAVAQQQMPTPQPAQLLQSGGAQAPVSERELALMKLQQETQAKYLEALNELQMLKVQKDIAETNKAIASAKLETITAQKGMVDLLQPQQAPVTAANYAAGLVNPAGATAAGGEAGSADQQKAKADQDSLTVVSVTHLQGRWNAVLGYGGKLMSAHVGDTLPTVNAKIISIDKSGVTLKMEDGTTKTISMVSII